MNSENNSTSNLHEKHRERMKKQLFAGDFGDNTPSHILLEMLLYFSIPRGDTNPLAHKLMAEFGSVEAVLSASKEQLCRVDGIGEHTAALIKTVSLIERRKAVEKLQNVNYLKTYKEMGDYAVKFFSGFKEERVALISLQPSGRIIATDIISVGDVTEVVFTQRQFSETALKRGASAVVLIHNHPSGILKPSAIDREVTRGIIASFSHINIKLADHIIVGENGYYSMATSPEYSELF